MPIVVNVFKRSGRRYFQAEWIDPTTGRVRSKSTQCTKRRDAEKFAGKLESDLAAGITPDTANATWESFREAYTEAMEAENATKTLQLVNTVFNHVENIIDPMLVSALDKRQIRRLTQHWRNAGRPQTTIKTYLSHLKAALRWAHREDMLATVPAIEIPKRATKPKGRAPTTEEFERMLASVESTKAVQGHVDEYQFLLRGLWWSGLRLTEALMLHWKGKKVRPDFSGRRPMLRFAPDGQKSGKAQLLPMAPEFAAMLDGIPADHRHGYIFETPTVPSRRTDTVSKRITAIGKQAGVKVRDDSGKVKFASAHDLRRAFGTRWAMRVLPPLLQQMMRHKDIKTTMAFYAMIEADDVADRIWDTVQPVTDTFTDTRPIPEQ